MDKAAPAKAQKRSHVMREIIETVILTLLLFFIIHSAVQNFNVDGTSMEPSLHNGELILVNKWNYLLHSPARGEVVVFIAPPQPSEDYIKRIIALPGDVISINNGVPTVNGTTLNESYVVPSHMGSTPFDRPIHDVIVPANNYFVMGDNRIGSSDSRTWGFVPRSNIIGQAAFVYWPLGENNDGFLPNVSSVFASVHVSSPAPASASTITPIAQPKGDILASGSLLLFIVTGTSWYAMSKRRDTHRHRRRKVSESQVRKEA
jgi:signal peptidase I